MLRNVIFIGKLVNLLFKYILGLVYIKYLLLLLPYYLLFSL